MRPRSLDYLIFDTSDEEDGACSFDAMASVTAENLPAMLEEVRTVLRWSRDSFGAASENGEGGDGEWDFDLHATDEADLPLAIAYDFARDDFSLPAPAEGRLTLALTVTGSHAFGEAFRSTFPDSV